MTFQVLFISNSSRTRRLYHRLLEDMDIEFVPAKSVADGLLQLVATNVDVLVIDHTLPVFEITLLLKILKEHQSWQNIRLLVLGASQMRHLYPNTATFIETTDEFVRKLKDISATL